MSFCGSRTVYVGNMSPSVTVWHIYVFFNSFSPLRRYEQIFRARCNITLVIKLQMEDNNRKWRCQVDTTENSTGLFLDFTSTFLFQNTPTAQKVVPSAPTDCPVQLPISRIVLCVALPVMVLIVGFFTWRGDRMRAKTSATGIELKEI